MMMMMRQTWLTTAVILLLAFLNNQWCHCCLKEERNIKVWIHPIDYFLWDWVDNSDCCNWTFVGCDNTTNRVTEIHLAFIRYQSNRNLYLNTSLFLSFQDLKILDLSYDNLVGSSENQGFEVLSSRLTKLEELYLSNNKFDDSILSSLRGFTSMKVLDLSRNMLRGSTDIYGFSNLINLEELFLSASSLSANFFQNIGALSSLKVLSLSECDIHEFPPLQGLKKLEELHLKNVSSINGSILVDSLRAFPSLKTLDLGDNNWNGTVIGPGLYNLTKLENLYLDASSELPTNFLQKIGSLHALKVLSLVGSDLKGTLPAQGWCELKNLEELYLIENKFEGKLPACLGNMTFLRSLDVSNNRFVGNIASSPLKSLTSLEYLSIQNNHFQIPSSFKSFMNLSNLKSFSCGDNNIITEPSIPHNLIPKFQLKYFSFWNAFHKAIPLFLYTQHELRFVDLSQNNMSGMFPFWMIENNSKLETLYLNRNSFGDKSFVESLRFPNHSSHNLKTIDISNNKIYGKLLKDICFLFPALEVLLMDNNKLSNGVPPCVGNMSSLSYLDLSNNFFTTGSLEQLISSRLSFLKLSNNYLDGEIPQSLFNSSDMTFLYLDGNNFGGKIWDFSSVMPHLLTLDISNNHISGKLPNWISNVSNLEVLDLSKNELWGHIPTEFCKLDQLQFLDLSGNDLSGPIPSCFNLPCITHVHLHKNLLSGQLIDSFANSSSLVTLNLKHNNLIGPIPNWIGNLSALEVLLLRANLFYGEFPIGLCSLENLSILDISQNKLTGALPSCIGNLSFNPIDGGKMDFGGLVGEVEFPDEIIDEVIEFTTKRNSYNYSGAILNFMSGIDLSCNNFTGDIPTQMGYLTGILALNLSHNNLHGPIPATLSNLQHIESLDLSYNSLKGRIPSQLTQITTLEVFNVSYNNLSGETPEMKNQFGTFDEYSYEGNPFLCGPPLQNNCNGEESPSSSNPDDLNGEYEDTEFIDMEVFYVSFCVCYIVVVLTILCINPYWRGSWFCFIEVCINTCYYFTLYCYSYVVDTFCKLTNFRRL